MLRLFSSSAGAVDRRRSARPAIPAPERVLRALTPLWPPLDTALAWATQQPRAYVDAEGTPIDRHLAPSLGRDQAKRYLARLGHDAPEEDGEA
jgi:hypothetical protein